MSSPSPAALCAAAYLLVPCAGRAQASLIFANGWIQAEAFDVFLVNGHAQLVAWTSSGASIQARFNPPGAGLAVGLSLVGSHLFAGDQGCGGDLGYYTGTPFYTCASVSVPGNGFVYTTNLWPLGQCSSTHQWDNWVWKFFPAYGAQSVFGVHYKASPCAGRAMPSFCAVTFDVSCI